MKILFDQGTPAPLRRHLPAHQVLTAFEMDWSSLGNGPLLKAAESESVEVFVTTDRNLRYQQNLLGRQLAIVVLPTTSWPKLKMRVVEIALAIEAMQAGGYREIK